MYLSGSACVAGGGVLLHDGVVVVVVVIVRVLYAIYALSVASTCMLSLYCLWLVYV